MKIRAKVKITAILRDEGGEQLRFQAVGKKGVYENDGGDENNTYAMFTPSAELTMTVNNPKLVGTFNPGEEYYLDFTRAE